MEPLASKRPKIELHPGMQVPELQFRLAQAGICNIDDVAQYHSDLLKLHRETRFVSYDGFTKQGSSSHATILDGKRSRDCIVWGTNHYLGLNRHPKVIAAVQRAVEEFGTGAGTSAMSGGHSTLHKQLERRLADKVGKTDAVLFSTGFTANLGAVTAMARKYDLILSDRENHASIIDGCRASGAKILPFCHNDVDDLERCLKRHQGEFANTFVLVESAYSMSGDLSPLKEIASLKEKYRFYLYVDEAHTFGFYGDSGAGYSAQMGVTDNVDFLMSTLSKATASVGGFVACEEKFATLLRYSARSYLFQACMPPSDVAAILAALDVIETEPEITRRLHEHNDYFRQRLADAGFSFGKSKSPVVPVFIKDLVALMKVTQEIFEQGIYTIAVTYPAVAMDEGRLRFIVNASHTRKDIDHTVDVLTEACRKHGALP